MLALLHRDRWMLSPLAVGSCMHDVGVVYVHTLCIDGKKMPGKAQIAKGFEVR